MFLKDKVAIVTGAGQGIGAAIAQAYAREGAKVAVVDMNAEAADAVAAGIRQSGGAAKGFACNVAERESVDRMASAVAAEWGRVDILVNNAGITRTAMLHKMTQEQWQQVIDVHMNGSFYCLQAVVNGMSVRARDSGFANSGIVAEAGTDDFGAAGDPLAGIAFQEEMERRAFDRGGKGFGLPAANLP